MWHYELIPALPNKMLVSQWRECIAIKRQWEKGSLKHRLVSYVKDYGKEVFYMYIECVVNELDKRKIKYKKQYVKELLDFCKNDITGLAYFRKYKEHNDRYFNQCYYNLEEKHDRGIITKEEWQKIEDLFKSEVE